MKLKYSLFSLNLLLSVFIFSCSDSTSSRFDEWPIASAESKGMDRQILENLTNDLQSGSLGKISSMLIIKNGYIVYEEYFNGFKESELHPVYSVTKSISSALIGIAIEKGFINGTSAKLYEFFPEYNYQLTNSLKNDITLKHVLQMRAGFEWDEWTIPYGSSQNILAFLLNSKDWIKFVLDRNVIYAPGSTFTYNSGCSILFSGIIKNSSEMNLKDFADTELFGPLGIENYEWSKGPNNIYNSGFGLRMRPRDMARFGYLYLKNGTWNGRTIISEKWIEDSWQRYTQFENGGGYGYQWWILAGTDLDNQTILIPYADGWGNQYIFVIPEYDMVVVSTAEHYNGEATHIRKILFDYIFVADNFN